MSEMIERVATALFEEGPDLLETTEGRRILARAAIAAMHEPTTAMLNAGDRLEQGLTWGIWEAMINAALDESNGRLEEPNISEAETANTGNDHDQ